MLFSRRQAMLNGMIGIVLICVLSGCGVRAYRVRVPRTDIEMAGNRGTLQGTPPEAPDIGPRDRELLQISIIVPGRAVEQAPEAPLSPAQTVAAPLPEPPAEAAQAVAEDTFYTVQKGDTLDKIAARPQVYGNAARWGVIYEANRDILTSPHMIRPGQRLRIPAIARETSAGQPDETVK